MQTATRNLYSKWNILAKVWYTNKNTANFNVPVSCKWHYYHQLYLCLVVDTNKNLKVVKEEGREEGREGGGEGEREGGEGEKEVGCRLST